MKTLTPNKWQTLVLTLWVYRCGCTDNISSCIVSHSVASERDRVTSEIGWINPHFESWGGLIYNHSLKQRLNRKKAFFVPFPVGSLIWKYVRVRVVTEEINCVIVTGGGIVGREGQKLLVRIWWYWCFDSSSTCSVAKCRLKTLLDIILFHVWLGYIILNAKMGT